MVGLVVRFVFIFVGVSFVLLLPVAATEKCRTVGERVVVVLLMAFLLTLVLAQIPPPGDPRWDRPGAYESEPE